MPNQKLNFIFWGTPDVASETLDILKENGYLPSLIITAPDAQKGRGLHMEASPVAIFAEKNNIPCLKPERLNDEFFKKLKPNCLEPNCLFITVAYGKIIPENIINLPKFGSINIHYSLLPKYRGASPVESAILNGDTETGVSIQKMEYKMDIGPILATEKVEIGENEKAPELRKRLIKIGGELLVKILPDFIDGKINLIPQNENEATYCKKIKKEDGEINLNDDAIKNYNKFRAYAYWPRTFFFKNNKRIIITDVVLENNPFDKAQDKQFIIKKVIPEGGKEIEYKG
ncbi:MAG: methionyl-tRNA formyltransferase [Candidatus Paceibacterota bacterium]|jgi:methionyl-tRNA formyltransferase